MNILLLMAIGIVFAVLLMAVAVYFLLRERQEKSALAGRVKDHSTSLRVAEATSSPIAQEEDIFTRILHSVGNSIKPKEKDEISLIQKRFLQAGYRGRNNVAAFFGSKALCAFCLSGAFMLFRILLTWQMSITTVMFFLLALALGGFYIPNVWLHLKTKSRQEEFLLAFPDALDLLVVCAEAGMGLDAAIKRVGDEMRLSGKVISEEFGLLNLELRAGRDRRDALKNLAMRVGVDEVKSWVTLLIQTDKFGTSVAQALRVHSDSMRVKRMLRVEELAAKLPVKLLFPTILFIFPSLFVVLMGPALIQVYRLWTR
jgi:tight adherence protein C